MRRDKDLSDDKLDLDFSLKNKKLLKQDTGIDDSSFNLSKNYENQDTENYFKMQEILKRLTKLCIEPKENSQLIINTFSITYSKHKPKKHEQRLLRNMSVHSIVLDLLKIPYDKNDGEMKKVMHLAHEFLQAFCLGNKNNQGLLYKHLDLFMTNGQLETQTMCAIFQGKLLLKFLELFA